MIHFNRPIVKESLYFDGKYKIGIFNSQTNEIVGKSNHTFIVNDENYINDKKCDLLYVKTLFKIGDLHVIIYKDNCSGLNEKGINKLFTIFNPAIDVYCKIDKKAINIYDFELNVIKEESKFKNILTINKLFIILELLNNKRDYIYCKYQYPYFIRHYLYDRKNNEVIHIGCNVKFGNDFEGISIYKYRKDIENHFNN